MARSKQACGSAACKLTIWLLKHSYIIGLDKNLSACLLPCCRIHQGFSGISLVVVCRPSWLVLLSIILYWRKTHKKAHVNFCIGISASGISVASVKTIAKPNKMQTLTMNLMPFSIFVEYKTEKWKASKGEHIQRAQAISPQSLKEAMFRNILYIKRYPRKKTVKEKKNRKALGIKDWKKNWQERKSLN